MSTSVDGLRGVERLAHRWGDRSEAVTESDQILDERACYWTVIDDPSGGHPNVPAVRMALDEAFERDLPEPIDGLVVRYAALPNAVIGCAIPMEYARAALDTGAIVLRPVALPKLISDMAGERSTDVTRSLNMLVDEFEPAAVAELRVSRRRMLVAGVAATLLLFAAGVACWSKWLNRHGEEVGAQTRSALVRALPHQRQGIDPNAARLALQDELQFLQRARGAEAEKARLRDATDALFAVLSAWPKQLEARVSSMQIASTQITLSVEVPDAATAEVLSAALQGVRGWNLQPPRTEIVGTQARMSVILRRTQQVGGESVTGGAGKETRS